MKRNQRKDIERRNVPVSELRAITDDSGLRKITGYAAVFNSLSGDLGGFREKIEPGAFRDSILTDDVRALWNHDSNYVLGRNTSGSLVLSEDERGLKIEINPPDAQWARDLMVSIDRGDVDKMSFGFRTIGDRWETRDQEEIRTLEKVQLFDVSAVTFPAYNDTEVGLRSLDEFKKANAPDDEKPDEISTVLLGEEDTIYRMVIGL